MPAISPAPGHIVLVCPEKQTAVRRQIAVGLRRLKPCVALIWDTVWGSFGSFVENVGAVDRPLGQIVEAKRHGACSTSLIDQQSCNNHFT